jgi:hypothetical protein
VAPAASLDFPSSSIHQTVPAHSSSTPFASPQQQSSRAAPLRHHRAPPRRSWPFWTPQLTARASIFLLAPPSRRAARARRGTAPSHGNDLPEFRPSSPERAAPWTPTLRSPSSFSRACISSAWLSRRSCTLSRAHRGRCWPPDGEQSRRSAIPAGELPPELPHR